MDKMKLIEAAQLRKDLPGFNIGDTIKVFVKVQEGEKARVHHFEGIVIRKKGSGISATFAVRNVFFGEGVERVFPFHSPTIDSIEVVSRGKVKRAKLYYLRERVGKQATKVTVDTEGQAADVKAAEAEAKAAEVNAKAEAKQA